MRREQLALNACNDTNCKIEREIFDNLIYNMVMNNNSLVFLKQLILKCTKFANLIVRIGFLVAISSQFFMQRKVKNQARVNGIYRIDFLIILDDLNSHFAHLYGFQSDCYGALTWSIKKYTFVFFKHTI